MRRCKLRQMWRCDHILMIQENGEQCWKWKCVGSKLWLWWPYDLDRLIFRYLPITKLNMCPVKRPSSIEVSNSSLTTYLFNVAYSQPTDLFWTNISFMTVLVFSTYKVILISSSSSIFQGLFGIGCQSIELNHCICFCNNHHSCWNTFIS